MPVDLHSQGKQKNLLIALFLSAIILAVYWQVQYYEFTNYDDQFYVLNNKNIQSGFTVKSIKYAFTDISTSNWHPVTMLSHMLDWTIYGKNAGGHHWTNVIIHIFNTVLLFLLFKTITGKLWRSAFVAALFAVHPINVESVAWIAERKNVLSTFFWITTMLLYIRYVRLPGWRNYFPVVLSFALGLMSKPMVVTMPFALLLLDYWPLKRTQINLPDGDQTDTMAPMVLNKQKAAYLILEKIPLFALSAIFVVVTFYASQTGKAVASLQAIPFDKRIANVTVSYAAYLKKMVWSFDLSAFYPFDFSIPLWKTVAATLLLVAITILVCRYYRILPYLAVGWFWYLGTLIPVIGLVHVGEQSMADRYAYVPFIGLFLILAWGAFDLLKKSIPAKILAFASMGIIAALMVPAYNQLKYWENSYTLFQNVIRYAPKHYLPYKSIALYWFDHDRLPEAAAYFRIAISLKKDDPILHNALGAVMEHLGDKQGAEREYKRALQIDPTYALAHNNLGALLLYRGQYDEALEHLRESVRLKPDLAGGHFNLSRILRYKGLDQEALFHHEIAIKINPVFKDLK